MIRFVGLLCFALVQKAAAQTVTFTINTEKKAQTIESFGASGAWFSEAIGRHWPAAKKDSLARYLFSKDFDKSGNPLGIGLSAWRFNAGGGTAEQGDSSGIANPQKRVECFLAPDGTYDWSKQQGYLWFVKKAAAYGVKDLILFSNTPPVQFTKNGLGFKTEKDYTANLKADCYDDYAAFLATVIQHFEKEGIRFRFVSPVNEPQWDWSARFGQMNQEGTPWHNKDIYKIVASLDSALSAKKLATKIVITEAGDLKSLYEGSGHASRQIQHFYAPGSPLFAGGFKHLHPIAAGHSYFTDNGDSAIIAVRSKLKDTAARYGVPFWQSEYSMLANGYKEGKKDRVSAIDCALFLAKIIHHDLAVANATAWHFWNAWEPGRPDFDTRYFLFALKKGADSSLADFEVVKNLWALGHYSRFIRPGMQRLLVDRSDGFNEIKAAQDLMLSAFGDGKKTVVVAINYTTSERAIHLKLQGIRQARSVSRFVTSASANDNMRKQPLDALEQIILPPRSIHTIVIEG